MIKVLYLILVLCTFALLGVVAACFLWIRRHMRSSHQQVPSGFDRKRETV
jgi:hypothetical protein